MRRRVSCFLMVLAFGAASACSDDDVPAKADSQVVADGQVDSKVGDAQAGDSQGGDGPAVDQGPKPDAGQPDLPQVDARTPDLTLADGPQAGCPATEPKVNDPCSTPKLQCGYGANAGCGDVYECFGGAWALAFDGATCGSTTSCPPSKPSSFCKAGDPQCRYGNEVCSCVPVCSGVQPPPGQDRVWSCATPQTVACPKSAPQNGAACAVEGQVCNYGSCGGSIATCTSGKWNVQILPPPP